jgi:hypothetical protein
MGFIAALGKRCHGDKGTTLPSSFNSEFFNADNQRRGAILPKEGVNEELARCRIRSHEHYYFCGAIDN